MASRTRVAFLLGAVIVVAYVAFAVTDWYSFRRAVVRDAERRGYQSDAIKSFASWPLEWYQAKLDTVSSPQQAEALVTDADTVYYYLAPVAGSAADTALVQLFEFRLARRVSIVTIHYSPNREPIVNGGDWIPSDEFLATRADALGWFSTISSDSGAASSMNR